MNLTIGAVIAAVGAFIVVKIGFKCAHNTYSFPITIRPGKRRTEAQAITSTYVACLKCGKELPYDWDKMRVLTTKEIEHVRHSAIVTSS